jgi:hypothetical protein
MIAIKGRIQREGDVIHFVAQQPFDLSHDLSSLADREEAFQLTMGRCDEFAHSSPGEPGFTPQGCREGTGHLHSGPAHQHAEAEKPKFH